jgi:hypothetical protein
MRVSLQARARKMPESDFRSLAETRQLHVQPLFDRLLSFTNAAGGELLFCLSDFSCLFSDLRSLAEPRQLRVQHLFEP